MAKTYTVSVRDVTLGVNKSLLSILNSHATRKVKIRGVNVVNNGTSTGITTTLELKKISASTGGTAVVPVARDSANVSMDLTDVICLTNGTITYPTIDPFRKWFFSSIMVMNNSQILGNPFDSNVEPITLNTGEGISISQMNINTLGDLDIFVEFTLE